MGIVKVLYCHVGDQYIDNASNDDRKLDAWFVNNLKIDYSIKGKIFKETKLHLMVNNLFDVAYESNAWVYSYFYGKDEQDNPIRYEMDGYFPQAGIHFFAGIDFKF